MLQKLKQQELNPTIFLIKKNTFNIWSCAILPRNFLSWENATKPQKTTSQPYWKLQTRKNLKNMLRNWGFEQYVPPLGQNSHIK